MPNTTAPRSWTTKAVSNLFTYTEQGLTQREIAKKLRRTPKAVERKVAKVRRDLATELKRKSYLTMTFPEIVSALKPNDTPRIAAAIAGGRI